VYVGTFGLGLMVMMAMVMAMMIAMVMVGVMVITVLLKALRRVGWLRQRQYRSFHRLRAF